MANVFDQFDTPTAGNEFDQFDELPTRPNSTSLNPTLLSGSIPFRQPDPSSASYPVPTIEQLRNMDLNAAENPDGDGFFQRIMAPLNVAGGLFSGALADIAGAPFSLATGDPSYTQNLRARFIGDVNNGRMPIDSTLSEIAPKYPALATVGKIGRGLAETAPMMAAFAPLPSLAQRLVAGGFSAKMLADAPEVARVLGEQSGTPESQRNLDDLTTAISDAVQIGAFAPLGGLGAVRDVPITRGDRARLTTRELSRQLRYGEMAPAGAEPAPIREVGVPTTDLANPDILAPSSLRELASQAMRETQSPIEVPGRVPAAELLRRQFEQQVDPVQAALKQEPLGGQISFDSPASAGAVPSARQAIPYFDRASEIFGLERKSTAPTVEDVRLQRESEANALQPETAQPVRDVRQEPIQGEAQMPAKIDSSKADVGGGKAPAQEISRISDLDPAGFTAEIKSMKERGLGMTEASYELAERLGKDDLLAIDAARDRAVAKRRELAQTDFQSSMSEGFKAQFFGELAKWRRAIDEAVESKAATPEELSVIEVKHGVGNPVKRGSELFDAVERFKQVKPERLPPTETQANIPPPSEAAPALELESVTALEPASGTALSATDALINKLEALRTPYQTKGVYSLPHPDAFKAIGTSVWNTAIDVAIAAVKAGKKIGEAIDAALGHIRKNAKDYDEAKIKENLEYVVSQESGAKAGESATTSALRSGQERSGEAVPTVEGTTEKMRQSAARATKSPSVPVPVQEKIAQAPESFYKVQPMKSVEESVSGMSDAELAAVPTESNIHVASQLELSKRLFDAGKLDEGYNVFQSVSKTGTEFGQNINQFKFLKGQNPLNVVHIVNGALKTAGKDPLTKPQAEVLAAKSKQSIDANKALDLAKDQWLKDPTDANAKAADAALKKVRDEEINLQREMSKFQVKNWPQMLKSFSQGNPLTPISQVANAVGNTVGAGMEAATRSLASQFDMIRSMLTGKDRKIKAQPIRGTIEAAKGFGSGLSQAPGIMLRGAGDVVKGETRQGLQPLRSFVRAFSKDPGGPKVVGKVPLNERARMAVEGLFGIPPEIMLRMLSAADKPAYESARSRLISEQSALQNIPKDQRAMAQKFPEMFFDREALKRIQDESSAAVFQRKSKTISYIESLIKEKAGDWGDLAFTILVAPYRLTPWNLVGRTLSYHPMVAAFRTAFEATKGNTRQAEINAARMVIGGMLYTAGQYLWSNGLVGPSMDSRDEAQKARLLAGEVLPPNHVNISGIKRLAKGGDPKYQPGDETFDLTRGGGAAGAILMSAVNMGRDFEKRSAEDQTKLEQLASFVKNSLLEQANFTINQSYLKGVTGVLDAVKDRNIEPYINGVENMLLNVATPNTLTTLSRATREYAPDLKADTIGKQFENVIRNRFGFAGLDDYLPVKRDLWGQPMKQTPEGRDSILYHFFDISKNKQVTDDPVSLELYDLWRKTDDSKVIPTIPSRTQTILGKTFVLTPEQYSRFSELVGKNRRLIAEPLVVNPAFQNLPNEAKIKMLDMLYRRGEQIGEMLFRAETPTEELKEKPKKTGFRE